MQNLGQQITLLELKADDAARYMRSAADRMAGPLTAEDKMSMGVAFLSLSSELRTLLDGDGGPR